MAQALYRVVESDWVAGKRIEKDIGCDWKTEARAKDELRTASQKWPGRKFSLQKKGK